MPNLIFGDIASSSHGNAYMLSDGQTTILIECGVPFKMIQRACGEAIGAVAACLVSHEHKDHSRCIGSIMRNGIRVITSAGTAAALGIDGVELIADREVVRVGTLSILAFSTYHDCAEPLGFYIKSHADGESIVFATDTSNLAYRFHAPTYLALEANYSAGMLGLCDRLPPKVRERIKLTHMDIDRLCGYISTLDLSACKHIYLLHLGDATSSEADFVDRVRRTTGGKIKVTACKRG